MRETCISRSELEDFLRSEDNEDPEIAAHLESCEECQNAMAEMSDLSVLDEFCPTKSDTALYAVAPEDTAIVDRLKSIPREARESAAHGEDLPQKIGRYEIMANIGTGGLGTVYLAYDRKAGHECIVKELSGRRPKNHEAFKKCLTEMKAHWKLGQSSLQAASSLEEDEGVIFLVAGYLTGVDLDAWVQKNGPLSVRDSCRAIGRAAIALQQVHSLKLLHLNVKPSNLFRTHDGAIVVLDCGLAPLVQDELSQGDLTRSAFVKSSVDFMSPEQARNVNEVRRASDIYSLGCTLAWLLSGRRLFASDSIMQTMVAHRESTVPDVSKLAGGAPPELNTVLAKMLAKQPQQRYQSMAEVAEALAPFFGEEPAEGDIISMPQAPVASSGGLLGWLSGITKRRK